MPERIPAYYFDKRDYKLLSIVNDVLDREKRKADLKNLLTPYLHPHGIKEMAASKGLRIAYAIAHLLGSLEAGKADDRISSLQSLRDEVLTTDKGSLRMNTARVLMQIMKELVRARGDRLRQLKLAHDFRMAASGKPRIIREQLSRYHLVEMPEEWNQVTFDDRVHDANTKGRKSPTHLIMDAWIKGIRKLTVVYYNFVDPAVAGELLEAAEIMDMDVHVGIQFNAVHRGRFARFIWTPNDFADKREFLKFLQLPSMRAFEAEGREASAFQQTYVFQVIREFNRVHLPVIEAEFGIRAEAVDEAAFREFVGMGQPSLVHLGKYIHDRLMPHLRARMDELRAEYPEASPEKKRAIENLVARMNGLDEETLYERFLSPSSNPSLDDPELPREGEGVPELLRLPPRALLERLAELHSGGRFILNPVGLGTPDVLEILYDCGGMVTHLELYNLKNCCIGISGDCTRINTLQLALNTGKVIPIKRVVLSIIRQAGQDPRASGEQVGKLTEILHDMTTLSRLYRQTPLKTCIGTGSTGRSCRSHGMGFALLETLPGAAQREIRRSGKLSKRAVPISATAYLRSTYIPGTENGRSSNGFMRFMRRLPGIRRAFGRTVEDWKLGDFEVHPDKPGNIVALGGASHECGNGFSLLAEENPRESGRVSLRYLNSGFKNALKVLIGFIPAFLTFALTKDWWLLAYFGAVIWFAITGVRNIIQSVLGGGGFRRSPLLRWNDYVSWERVCESLLYTGFSVPLLDWLVKTVFLSHGLNITTMTNPIALYSVLALANGIYISSHNAFRGLPKGAIFGNFFRSILSIPLAIVFNAGVGMLLAGFAVPGVDLILQKWAAVISKFASDCVAGIIEGLADRQQNIRTRRWDYAGKIDQVFSTFETLELQFPEEDMLAAMRKPKRFIRAMEEKETGIEKIAIINALDLLYFWMYQPRARVVLRQVFRDMSPEERKIFLASQFILKRNREITQLFVDGIVGKYFSGALAFYLNRYEEYLRAMARMAFKHASKEELPEYVPASHRRVLKLDKDEAA